MSDADDEDLETRTEFVLELHRLQQMEARILALMEQYADSPMLSFGNVWKAVHG